MRDGRGLTTKRQAQGSFWGQWDYANLVVVIINLYIWQIFKKLLKFTKLKKNSQTCTPEISQFYCTRIFF